MYLKKFSGFPHDFLVSFLSIMAKYSVLVMLDYFLYVSFKQVAFINGTAWSNTPFSCWTHSWMGVSCAATRSLRSPPCQQASVTITVPPLPKSPAPGDEQAQHVCPWRAARGEAIAVKLVSWLYAVLCSVNLFLISRYFLSPHQSDLRGQIKRYQKVYCSR